MYVGTIYVYVYKYYLISLLTELYFVPDVNTRWCNDLTTS